HFGPLWSRDFARALTRIHHGWRHAGSWERLLLRHSTRRELHGGELADHSRSGAEPGSRSAMSASLGCAECEASSHQGSWVHAKSTKCLSMQTAAPAA